jgi:hypothetical protein
MAFVSTAEEGVVWALDQTGSLWILNTGTVSIGTVINNVEEGWTLVEPEKLVQIDTGYHGLTVARNSQGQTFFRDGVTTSNLMGTAWLPFESDPAHVSITMCANRNIFAVGMDGVVRHRGGVDDQERRTPNFDAPMGLNWVEVNANPESYGIDQVSCGYKGKVWASNPDGQVFRRTEIDADHPAGTAWTFIESVFNAKMVSVGA